MWQRISTIALFVTVLAMNLLGSMSVTISTWWGAFANPANHDLPPRLEHMLSLRKHLREADTHAAMWLAAGIAVLLVARRRSIRLGALAGLFALTGLVEVAQATLTTRNAQWGDLVGGGIGLAVAALIGEFASLHRRRAERRSPPTPGRARRPTRRFDHAFDAPDARHAA